MWTTDRYLVRELLPPFALGLGGFLVILVGDILYTLAEYIASGRVTLDVVVRLLVYKLPAIMVVTFPVSTLFASLLGLSRLAHDRELQAIRLMGVGLPRLFAPVVAFGLVIAGLTFLTNEVITPLANQRANTLIRRALFGEVFPEAREQVFLRAPGNRFLYIQRVDDRIGILYNVMIYEIDGPLPRLITAREATWAARTWSLRRGVVREIDERGFTTNEAAFGSMRISVGLDAGRFFAAARTPEEMTVRELRGQVETFRGGLTPRVAIEYHRKFAVPAASLIFAFLAAPLSLRGARGGRFVGVAASIALLFVYYVVMSIARALGTTGVLSAVSAAWAPNALFFLGGIGLIVWEEGWFRRPSRVPSPRRADGARS